MDNWICGQPLTELVEGPLTREDMCLTIADFWTNNDWRGLKGVYLLHCLLASRRNLEQSQFKSMVLEKMF